MDAQLLLVLTYTHRKFSIREIAFEIGKTIGTVQQCLKELEESGYVINPAGPRKARSRQLTEAGIALLKSQNLLQ